MRVSIVSIGNYRGIKIPDTVMKQCGFDDEEAELEINGNILIVKPVKEKPRKNWDKAFKIMAQRGEDILLIDDSLDIDT
ncbi:AbrB/MazE/SpoVT family DNA-binding domain-containing protein [Candidatus Magnetobacterium casensis]|uniref:AbrB/MazE/SpoVT family DNA-binding domain-containing protein n=1 Tax=Candidatus Magnetobacterium casense TaxID=1455061 RepID=A0ABS6RZJ0_9BACT|nr:AbrB/MazE/SpoVT family DNA-binding domain-containing protein [Candidatus Magnetobacterium casensis]